MFFGKRKAKNVRGFRKREIKVINKPVYENPYFRKKRTVYILRLIKNPGKFFLFLLVMGILYFIFYSSYFKIEVVDIQGTQELTYDQVHNEINKTFGVRRFVIFKQSNLFIYDIKAGEQALWNTFVLEEVRIKKRLPNKIIVKLKEKIPNLTFVNKNKYYYLDLEGIVTHEISEEEIKKHFPLVEDLNERVIKLKDKILPVKIIDAIFELNENFTSKTNTNIVKFMIPEIHCPRRIEPEEKNLEKESLNINTNQASNTNLNYTNSSKNSNSNGNTNISLITEQECDIVPLTQDINVKTEEGWEAFFTTTDNIATQLERLKIYLLRKSMDNESRANIDYIDLRFGEKIFLKEK